MKITIQYETQLKRAIGAPSETVEVHDGASVTDIVRAAAERHDGAVRSMLLDGNSNVHSSVLMFVEDQQLPRDSSREFQDGEILTLMSPISGG